MINRRINAPGALLLVCVCTATARGESVSGPHLQLGSVQIALGAPTGPTLARLRQEFSVRDIEGGWEIRSKAGTSAAIPMVGLGADGERIDGVSFTWGPGWTQPTLHDVMRQLALAVPNGSECKTEHRLRPQEGGLVTTIRFMCNGYNVVLVTGTWTGGNTTTLALDAVRNAG